MVASLPATDPTRIGTVPPGTPPPAGIRKLHLILIRPSKYDDDGYVMRYVRGVLPSNTLATLAALTEEAAEAGELGDIEIEIRMMDEFVQKIDPRRLARRFNRHGARPVVALCGVQTNQFPRAADLAREFRAAGLTVMMGGFHVSGSIAMSPGGAIPPECQALIDAGVTLVKGEVEETWGDLLRDALHGRLKPFYDITARPDLSRANIPVVDPKLMKRFAYPYMGTIDAGRGCPMNCSFCTIINVQGRKMRYRLAEKIKERIRRNVDKKIDYYFFTDDNFARNPNWEAILDALIELRRDEGIVLQFMMQIDAPSYRIKNFSRKAAEAGCSQVFIGMETINPANIEAADKTQNNIADYANMIEAWHAHGIACHVGYIIGFPFDTVESVRDDVRRLRDEIRVDQASFFMLTPLPGSRDHVDMVRRGEWMDDDYNRFDSFHPTTRHPRMNAEEWFGVYREAWRVFYSTEAMKAILNRANDNTYWGLFKNFIWYKYSAVIEETHPMICGFFRIKDRRQRRPGYAPEPFWRHYRRRAGDVVRLARECGRLYLEMQEVWLATRGRAQINGNLEDLRRQYDELLARLGQSRARAGEVIGRRVAGVRAGAQEAWIGAQDAWHKAEHMATAAGDDLATRLEHLRRLQRPRLTAVKQTLTRLNPLALHTHTRAHLDAYWRQTYQKLRRGDVLRINPLTLTLNALRDAKLCFIFNLTFLTGFGR